MSNKVKLTTRGKYAVMAMVELARNESKAPLPLSEIAKEAKISLSYLEQLIAALRKHDLVKSFRGPGGGYVLAKQAEEIFISQILIAAEDSTPAKRNGNGGKNACDKTNLLWDNIGRILHISLQTISLKDVLNERVHQQLETSKLFDLAG